MQPQYSIVVFSHLRWNFVYQRPQHLLSRLAATRPVFFVEEPEFDPDGAPRWERSSPQPNVVVLRPHSPIQAPGFHANQQPLLEPLIAQLADELEGRTIVTWLYTPMALPLAQALAPAAMVYDCMDELSLFLGAPPELLSREAELIECADVMFTGGPSLFRAKQSRHPSVHCFSSSVDAAHFRVRERGVQDAEDQVAIPHPRLGFYGVIDERLDLPLIDFIAEARPQWHIVLVGPVVKIDPTSLPRRDNIHYFGQRTYDELPATWPAGTSASFPSPGTMPPGSSVRPRRWNTWRRNSPSSARRSPMWPSRMATSFISATRPRSSSPPAMRALNAGPDEQASRIAGMREVLASTSWDATAAAMEQLLAAAVVRKTAVPA